MRALRSRHMRRHLWPPNASILPPCVAVAAGKVGRALWVTLLNSDAAVCWQATKANVADPGELAYVLTFSTQMSGVRALGEKVGPPPIGIGR